MRNLVEYPITKEEVISALDTALQRESDDDRIGSIDAYILQCLYEKVALKNIFDPVDFQVGHVRSD